MAIKNNTKKIKVLDSRLNEPNSKNDRVEESIPNSDEVITNLVTGHIRNHTIQFFKKTGDSAFVPEGTGVLIHLYDVFCVLTTGNVTADDFNYLYFQCGPNNYIPLSDTSRASADKVINPDVDYVILAQEVVDQLLAIGKQFLPLEKILLDHTGQQTHQYAIFGYPSDYANHEEDNFRHDGFLFKSTMADDQPYDPFIYKKDTHFILPYSNPIDMSTGVKSAKRQVYDLRGSGLWYISFTKQEDKVDYDYHLIGIMKEYYQHKRAQYIVANKIQSLTDQLTADLSIE